MPESSTPIVIFGSGGLLGRHVVREYAGEKILALKHEDLDVTDAQAVAEMLDRVSPEVVINCAALCNFQRCEDEPSQSEKINRDAPIRLAAQTAARGIRLVHFSTDYIFDGKSEISYREDDAPNPLCVYGAHKAVVEAAFRTYSQHLLLRVAWLFGEGGKTFLSLLPQLLRTRETLEVAAGKTGTCLHVGFAAKIIHQMAKKNRTGLYNLVHPGVMSWEGFAAECLRQLSERGLSPQCRKLIEVPVEKISALSGNRPMHSALNVEKLTREIGVALPDWRVGLSDYLDELYPASMRQPALA